MAPFGVFGAKIAIARAFGVIGPHAYSAMDYLRSMRNDFAHHDGPAVLTEEDISTLLSRMSERGRSEAEAAKQREAHTIEQLAGRKFEPHE